MNFRSIAQLSDQLVRWSRTLPKDIDLVVGIPRSGLLVASILAAYRNIPLADVDGFVEGRCYRTGRTKPQSLNAEGAPRDAHLAYLDTPRRVLVVDDTVSTGQSIKQVRARIESAGLPHRVEYGAVYALPNKTEAVDHYCEVLTAPRIFEWNLFQQPFFLPKACVDMDGVLCQNPSYSQCDDGEAYLRFLSESRPYLTPTVPIGWIVTSRLERYRAQTEAWLRDNGIEYGDLIMLDYPDGSSRQSMMIHSAYKADVYRKTGAQLFIESDIRQAVEIASLARRDVLCVDTMQIVHPGSVPRERPVAFGDASAPSLPRKIARELIPRNVRTDLLRLVRRSNGRS